MGWSDADALDDADPGQQDLLWWLPYTNTHGLQRSCGGKGTARPLSQEESASERLVHSLKRRERPDPCLDRLLLFF